jgi:hypothetical protein
MAGLVPAIHAFGMIAKQDVDAHDKRGHDAGEIGPVNMNWGSMENDNAG